MLTLRSEFMATASGHCQELRSQTLAVSPPIPSSPAPTSSGLRHSQYLRPSHQAPPPRAQVSDTPSISAHPIKPRPHELRSQMLPVSPPIPSSPAPTSSGLRHSQYLRPSHQAPPPRAQVSDAPSISAHPIKPRPHELRSQMLPVSPPIPSSPAPTSSGLRHSQYLCPSHQAPPPRAQVSDTPSISAHPIKPRPHELRSQMLAVSPPIPSSPAPTSSGLRCSQYLRPSHQAPPPRAQVSDAPSISAHPIKPRPHTSVLPMAEPFSFGDLQVYI